MKKSKDYPEMTNEEYREKIREMFDEINDNKVLRFWYRSIDSIEKE